MAATTGATRATAPGVDTALEVAGEMAVGAEEAVPSDDQEEVAADFPGDRRPGALEPPQGSGAPPGDEFESDIVMHLTVVKITVLMSKYNL